MLGGCISVGLTFRKTRILNFFSSPPFTGSVTGVRNIAHPIALARKVMENTPHVFLMGSSANDFAAKMGFENVSDEYLMTNSAKTALEEFLKSDGEPVTTEIGQ